MDPRLAEEIKRRNKLKLQQWEDKLKIVGKFDKSDTSEGSEAQKEPVQQTPKMPFNELDSELTSMFDTMQGIQNAQNTQNEHTTSTEQPQQDSVEKVAVQSVPQVATQQSHEIKPQVAQSQPVSKEDEVMAKFDIGPFNIAAIATNNATVSVPVNTQSTVSQNQTVASVPQSVTQQPSQQVSIQSQSATTKPATQTPPILPQVQEDENAKYIHIDIVDGKIKLARKNMSIEEAVSLLAKVYNSYKSKM